MNSSAYAFPAPNRSHYNPTSISIPEEEMFSHHDNLAGDIVELTLRYIITAVALMFGYYMTLVLSTRLFGLIICLHYQIPTFNYYLHRLCFFGSSSCTFFAIPTSCKCIHRYHSLLHAFHLVEHLLWFHLRVFDQSYSSLFGS